MSKFTVCDCCGKHITGIENYVKLINIYNGENNYDLCNECFGMLKNVLNDSKKETRKNYESINQ